ncbi:hypothetical protein AB1K83_13525 [Sporosarcina sp. 179-K 3D1 HS]|uniref:hypothetical protein n=1 Tax=Sporosarcina sp. 179-K 3D1 HS TaxID=3232169 RepID=UPI0039A0F84F
MIRKPLRHSNRQLFHSSNRYYEGAAVTSVSSAWMVDEFLVEPKELAYLQYEEEVVRNYEELVQSQAIDSGVSMDYARSEGVQNEWEIYHFFAQEEVNAPTEVFEYIDDDGNKAYFTEEQQQQIQQWDPGTSYPIAGIEGHHIETIKENPTDTVLAADPDNILFATAEAHRTHLHDGNTQNPTNEAYIELKSSGDDKLANTLSYNEDLITFNFWEAGALAATGSAAIYVTASMIIDWAKLRKDPRPWIQKRKDLAIHSMMAGIMGLGMGAIGYTIHTGIAHVIGDYSIAGLETFFESMLAINGTFFAISLTAASLTYFRLRRQGQTHEQAFQQFKSLAITSLAEFTAFSVLGIGIELGIDTLGGLALEAVLPDPTGILIAGRLLYSAFKIGKKYMNGQKEKTAFETCEIVRRDFYYQQALQHQRQYRLE